jgi:hypothetical protein
MLAAHRPGAEIVAARAPSAAAQFRTADAASATVGAPAAERGFGHPVQAGLRLAGRSP